MKILASLLCLLAASLAHADLVEHQELIDEVRCREIGFSKAAEARDAVRFESFLDADARFVGSSVARGPQAIVAAWVPFFQDDGPSIRWRPQFVEVLADGSLALTRGLYQIAGVDADGEAFEQWGTFNSIWRPGADGIWRVVFDAGNSSPETPPEDIQAVLDEEDSCAAAD